AATEAFLDDGERKDAIAEGHDLAVQDHAVAERERRRLDFRKAVRNVVHRARVDARLSFAGVNLRTDAVVFVIRERSQAKGRDNLHRIFFRLREHESEWMKEAHLRRFEGVAAGE